MSERPGVTPVLFLDVDGVISLFGFDAEPPAGGSYHWINGVPHYISGTCGGHLERLAASFELVWATGWEETANEYLPFLLGLPGELPVVSFDEIPRFGVAHWKLTALERYAGPNRPLAWIDDCIDEECHAWAKARLAPTLLVHTRAHEGMSPQHVEELLAWATGLESPSLG